MTDRKRIREIIGYTHQEQLDNADLWYKSSISFHEASTVLYENRERVSGAEKIFQFNAALSLELIFKAILAAKEKAIPQTHKLSELSSMAEVDLDDDQICTLELLTECIVWLARYPSPKTEKKWDKFRDNILERHMVHSQSGNIHSTLANPKRFPTMENYTKIWEICLAKFASV